MAGEEEKHDFAALKGPRRDRDCLCAGVETASGTERLARVPHPRQATHTNRHWLTGRFLVEAKLSLVVHVELCVVVFLYRIVDRLLFAALVVCTRLSDSKASLLSCHRTRSCWRQPPASVVQRGHWQSQTLCFKSLIPSCAPQSSSFSTVLTVYCCFRRRTRRCDEPLTVWRFGPQDDYSLAFHSITDTARANPGSLARSGLINPSVAPP